MTEIHLAIPPNIVRKTTADLKAAFPGITVREHQTHPEMDRYFSTDFSDPEKTSDLTLCAYPAALAMLARNNPEDRFDPMPDTLPPMRSTLADAGLLEYSPFFRVAAVVPLIIIAHKEMVPFPKGWGDLCRDEMAVRMVIPPDDTPAPALYAKNMQALFGDKGIKAAEKVKKRLMPQAINTAVDEGEYAAGMVFPAFARTFRNNNAAPIWPEEGAFAIPLLVFLKKGASDLARQVLHHVFSIPFQQFLGQSGLFCSVREEIPFPLEMTDNQSRIFWAGWDAFTESAHAADRKMA